MCKALPGGQDISPSHADVGSVAAFPGASATGDPTSHLCVACALSPFILETTFILSSKGHNWHFCVNADTSPPLRPRFNNGVANRAKFKKAKCVWPDSWLHVQWKKPKINSAR